jgi:hypothetical protein
MSTFFSTPSAGRPIRSGLSCLALCTLAGLVPEMVAAAVPEPALRASTQLDAARLGKISENERAVLRVEWRSAMTSAEEAQAVQQMLDSLRRMEDTTAQIGRLVRGIPAPRPAVTSHAARSGNGLREPGNRCGAGDAPAAAGFLVHPAQGCSRRRRADPDRATARGTGRASAAGRSCRPQAAG